MKMFLGMAALAAFALSAPPAAGQAQAQAAPDPAMQAALSAQVRAEDAARDAYRHPAETLAFFQVGPGMTVVDYMPAGGWYTRILVPYLGPQGTYIGMNPDVTHPPAEWMSKMADFGASFPDQVKEWLGEGGAKVIGINTNAVPEALNGTVDRVLMFREFHNQYRFGWLHDDLVAIRKLLKDDGMVGVVEHRAKPDAPASYTDGGKGYMREKDVIALFDAAGFELVGKSEVNANPKDPANWPAGVWTLPPGLAGATDETRPKLLEIGESDRMTLLFRKRP